MKKLLLVVLLFGACDQPGLTPDVGSPEVAPDVSPDAGADAVTAEAPPADTCPAPEKRTDARPDADEPFGCISGSTGRYCVNDPGRGCFADDQCGGVCGTCRACW